MYDISQKFKDGLKQHEHIWLTKVEINGVEYGMDSIVDFAIDNSLTLSDEFEIGTAVLGKLTLSMRTVDDIPSNAKVIPYVALSLADGYTEWLQMGEYYIDNRSKTDKVWVYECYDKLVWADVPYISQLTYPATMQAIWDEICDSLDFTYDSTVVINPSYTVPGCANRV